MKEELPDTPHGNGDTASGDRRQSGQNTAVQLQTSCSNEQKIDVDKRRTMNRESAKRTRKRKQQQLQDLEQQVAQLSNHRAIESKQIRLLSEQLDETMAQVQRLQRENKMLMESTNPLTTLCKLKTFGPEFMGRPVADFGDMAVPNLQSVAPLPVRQHFQAQAPPQHAASQHLQPCPAASQRQFHSTSSNILPQRRSLDPRRQPVAASSQVIPSSAGQSWAKSSPLCTMLPLNTSYISTALPMCRAASLSSSVSGSHPNHVSQQLQPQHCILKAHSAELQEQLTAQGQQLMHAHAQQLQQQQQQQQQHQHQQQQVPSFVSTGGFAPAGASAYQVLEPGGCQLNVPVHDMLQRAVEWNQSESFLCSDSLMQALSTEPEDTNEKIPE